MIAMFVNLLIIVGVLAGLSFLTLRFLIPYAKRLKVEEERVLQHEKWLSEQQRIEAKMKDDARKELESELGTVDVVLGASQRSEGNNGAGT